MATKKKTTTRDIDMSDVMTVDTEEQQVDFTKVSTGPVRIDDSALVNVKSNVLGELIFIDPVTKETMRWPQCGEVLPLPFATLRHMKTGAVKFFTNQMVIITGFADENADKYEPADIYRALYITQYYKDVLDPTNYDEICRWTPADIQRKVPLLSAGSKGKLVVALNTYIEKGILDSLKAIKTFEEVLGCDLKRPE